MSVKSSRKLEIDETGRRANAAVIATSATVNHSNSARNRTPVLSSRRRAAFGNNRQRERIEEGKGRGGKLWCEEEQGRQGSFSRAARKLLQGSGRFGFSAESLGLASPIRHQSSHGADFGPTAGFLARRRLSSGEKHGVREEIMAFNRGVAIEEAATPPSFWYTDPRILDLELETVFERRWLAVGRVAQVRAPGDFFTGTVGRVRYVVCVDEQGTLRAFHNVCRHHAAAVATGSGCASSFVCPYHGWTYGLDGRLQKAARLGGIRNFSARLNGLSPLLGSQWGPFVLIKAPSKDAGSMTPERELLGSVAKEYAAEKEWLGNAAKLLTDAEICAPLRHVATREYRLNCNWKVFCDNYLDGGYHFPYAHASLASDLDAKTYSTTLYDKVSIQRCRAASVKPGDGDERIGQRATYAFIYPNFMINRYGPWMDTNLVLPVTASQCRVIFDYFVENSCRHDEHFIKDSLERSDVVQQEDIVLCEAVQNGLQSPAYDVGRYAPSVEHAMHRFHTLLHEDLSGDSQTFDGMDADDLKQMVLRDSSA